ncbi:MAG: hypothetical protein ABI178_03965, partial [Rhodanobacter sp.]
AMDYLTYAYIQRGQRDEAERVVHSLDGMAIQAGGDFKVGYALTAMPIRLAMEDREWAVASSLQAHDGLAPEVAALVYWARAVANARGGNAQRVDDDIARLDTCRQQLLASKKTYWATQVDILEKEARAWQAVARARADDGLATLRAAADEEDGVEKLPLTPGPILPAREQLGDLYLQIHEPRHALRAYETALAAAPGRRGALHGAALAADAAGDTQTAIRMRRLLSHSN